MNYFNEKGRRIPTKEHRVFDQSTKNYYQIEQPKIKYENILKNSIKFGGVDQQIQLSSFEMVCEELKQNTLKSIVFSNLFKGVHVPFICCKKESIIDLGGHLESSELTNFQKAFNTLYPDRYFKAILQSDSKLLGNITLSAGSRYENFLEACAKGVVAGWYFPQALQEFDINSQRLQMSDLPDYDGICLSGGIDIIAALIGIPDLLISDSSYAPILCLSSYIHADPRLVLLMKAYGPHMEFWCMTQMLTKTTTQVSEQWAGGLTIYKQIG